MTKVEAARRVIVAVLRALCGWMLVWFARQILRERTIAEPKPPVVDEIISMDRGSVHASHIHFAQPATSFEADITRTFMAQDRARFS